MKKENAITLISLIVTILVMLILASVTINLVIDDRIFEKTNNAVANHQLEALKEELEVYHSKQQLKEKNKYYNPKILYAYYDKIVYISDSHIVKTDENKNIYDILRNLKGSKFDGKIWIKGGEIVFEPIDYTLSGILEE